MNSSLPIGFRISTLGFLPPRVGQILLGGLLFAACAQPASLFACAACYGKSDSPLAQGMNWGIFSLLGVIVPVLGGIAAFFVFLARKAAAVSAAAEPQLPPPAPSTSPAQ
jgi:hypothetical protein